MALITTCALAQSTEQSTGTVQDDARSATTVVLTEIGNPVPSEDDVVAERTKKFLADGSFPGTGESNLMRRSGASTYIRLPKIRGQCLPTEIRLAFVWGCSLQPRHSAWASCMESPPLLYVERIDPELIQRLGISKEKASQPDVYLRIPVYKESVFRAAVEQKGLPVSDVLQIWLDVSNHSSRGKEQADRLREQILEPPLSNK